MDWVDYQCFFLVSILYQYLIAFSLFPFYDSCLVVKSREVYPFMDAGLHYQPYLISIIKILEVPAQAYLALSSYILFQLAPCFSSEASLSLCHVQRNIKICL